MTKLTFTVHPLQGIEHNKDATRELKKMRKLFKRGDMPPESVWVQANTILAEKSRAESFSTRRPYIECMREILHREPWLSLGIGPYLRDREFSGITFTTEEASTDDDET